MSRLLIALVLLVTLVGCGGGGSYTARESNTPPKTINTGSPELPPEAPEYDDNAPDIPPPPPY